MPTDTMTAPGREKTTVTPIDTVRAERNRAIWKLFEHKFSADYRITVGSATCEHAAGSRAVYDRLQRLLQGVTDRKVALGQVGCAGRCDMEPVVTVIGKGDVPVKYVHVTPARVEEIFESHIMRNTVVKEYCMRHVEGWGEVQRLVTVSTDPDDERAGGRTTAMLMGALERCGLTHSVSVTRATHDGAAVRGPVLHIYPDGVSYADLDRERIDRIVEEHLRDNAVATDLVYESDRIANRSVPLFGDVYFFGKQLRMTLRNCGVIDPESIDEYLAVRGYEAAARAVERMTPREVVQAVELGGLRGRGGGGFSAAAKWAMAAANVSDEKFVICNADEGDPGAFMDRSTIEGDPHTVVEGMIIAGYAIGATRGFVYTRVEYPLAIERMQKAIDAAREHGFLGSNAFGSGWDFDIEVRLGAGAFVCGEETALIASIEGYRGEPRQKPPFPSDRGLWGKPTIINNVETLANLPVVLLDGPGWFRSVGTKTSRGTKVFALAGKVRHTGLIEVPMGTTLREVIYDIGGGIPEGKEFKAVQTGGPAGGCLPREYLDTPVDYESLRDAGSIMGSGGMIVMDEDSCMVDVARYFMEFMVDESCGQCTPCRAGTTIMYNMLNRICEGRATMEELEKLEATAKTVGAMSICGLGKAAPNPVLSTLRYFRDEYVEHIESKTCRARVCTKLRRYEIDPEACIGCGACRRACPSSCILGTRRRPHEIVQGLCVKCGSCETACKFGAVVRT